MAVSQGKAICKPFRYLGSESLAGCQWSRHVDLQEATHIHLAIIASSFACPRLRLAPRDFTPQRFFQSVRPLRFASHKMSASTPSKPKPCHVCGDVDLKAAFGRFNVGTNMYADLAADLQTTLGQLKSSDCPKCQFLTATLHCEDPPRFEMKDMEDSDAICLRKFSIAQLLQDRPASSGTLLGVVPLLPQRQSRPFGWPASDYTGLLATTGFIGRSHAGAEADGESKESPTTALYRVLQLDTSSVNTDRIKQ